MVVALDELIQSIELWLKLIKKEQSYVNPNLDPVLLVPGIGGSIMNAVNDEDGSEERVWVRILGADHEFRTKLWSRFDPSTGHTSSLDPKTRIVVPEDRYGLYAIDNLDPDLIIGQECVCYYHDMIEEMIQWGYQEGKTLFGFGYDFRQSNRLQEILDRFSAKLESVCNASGGKKINIITHSMGGLLVKCFMSLHTDIFEKYVKNWIAIAAPFQGAPGYITSSLLNGMSFVEGWEQNFFISKWSMQQLLVECPSIYELMGHPDYDWDTTPLLQIWREKHDSSGNACSMLESYEPGESISILEEALSNNKVNYNREDMLFPFNLEISKWADETRKIFSCAEVPPTVKFYNIYGVNNSTPHSVCYGCEQQPVSDLQQLLSLEAKYIYVDGDGTVPVESAKADWLRAEARVGVPGDHRGIVCDPHVFRLLKHWLKAGEPDPFYNPLNDYVILPTAFDIATHRDRGLTVNALNEDWEIISGDTDKQDKAAAEQTALVGSVSVAHVKKDQPYSETHATIVVHPRSEGKQHVELRAVSVTTSG
ncbi:hypothetical protein MRB53_020999 [Persea americana]|uniref:Uncharacterized protein n=1 Tax=Persea americana TaxID=3435 RepID=A0ACC2L3N3_PERAE|nr:hypothetical protein MRB53_020999 [Persea americana]